MLSKFKNEPGVVDLHGFFCAKRESDVPGKQERALLMQLTYHEAGTLDTLIAEKRRADMGVDQLLIEVLPIFSELVDTLARAHQLGVVHRE